MIKKFHYILTIIMALAMYACEDDPTDYEIEYQNGYPNRFVGTWQAVELSFGIDGEPVLASQQAYDMIVALDPQNPDSLILDNIYNSNLRVKANIDNAQLFSINKGRQLEFFSASYDVETISLNGAYFFDIQTNSDALQMNIGLYDEFNSLFDSIVVIAYRKTGFENLDEYQQDF